MTMDSNVGGSEASDVNFSLAVGMTRNAVGSSAKPASEAAPRRRRSRGKISESETHSRNGAAPSAALGEQPVVDHYHEFMAQLQRDRTLPPERGNPNAPDITHLTLEQLSNSEDVYNRELSWLDFNWRVLHEAIDARTPLLERLKFVAIASSNLDEYFSKRVGGLKRQRAAGMANLTLDGWTPEVQLRLIASTTRKMVATQSACLHDDILPELAQHGVRILHYSELSPEQTARLRAFYLKEIYPILTPLAVDPGHPFPFISSLSLSLGVSLRDPATGETQLSLIHISEPTRPY